MSESKSSGEKKLPLEVEGRGTSLRVGEGETLLAKVRTGWRIASRLLRGGRGEVLRDAGRGGRGDALREAGRAIGIGSLL